MGSGQGVKLFKVEELEQTADGGEKCSSVLGLSSEKGGGGGGRAGLTSYVNLDV